jgi:hypothetical protein
VSVWLLVAIQSTPIESFQARPEIDRSDGVHWLMTSPGLPLERPWMP